MQISMLFIPYLFFNDTLFTDIDQVSMRQIKVIIDWGLAYDNSTWL